jgi:hypothetical protein
VVVTGRFLGPTIFVTSNAGTLISFMGGGLLMMVVFGITGTIVSIKVAA